MKKQITKKEAREKYGIITSGINSQLTYFLLDNGKVQDSDGDIRYIPLKLFYIRAEMGEGYPDYNFVLKATTLAQANKVASVMLKQDYPETFTGKYADRFACYEVTPEQLVDIMLLN